MRRSLPAAVCVALASVAGCTALQSGLANRTSVPEVERWVDAALPIGSSREQIETWLTEQGIEHSVSEIPVVECDGLHCRDVGKCLTVFGVIRNTERSVLVNGSIQLTFFLGESGKLTERSVKWVGTGP